MVFKLMRVKNKTSFDTNKTICILTDKYVIGSFDKPLMSFQHLQVTPIIFFLQNVFPHNGPPRANLQFLNPKTK